MHLVHQCSPQCADKHAGNEGENEHFVEDAAPDSTTHARPFALSLPPCGCASCEDCVVSLKWRHASD
ncbi:hypothetical protein OAO87_01065 [bacterium]|nr:hypothetical protein [bacterium]